MGQRLAVEQMLSRSASAAPAGASNAAPPQLSRTPPIQSTIAAEPWRVDVAYRFLQECPWQRLRDLRAAMPHWETPEFSGLVLDRLAQDPDLAALSGQALIGAELGERYGIRDTDGKQPLSYRATMGAPTPFAPPVRQG